MRTMFQTAAVLQVFDYLTAQPMQNLRATLPNGYRCVPKGNGYFVLLGEGVPSFVQLQATGYCALQLTAVQADMVVWMHPQITSHTALVPCTVQAEHTAYAYRPQDLRLLSDVHAQDTQLTLYAERMPVLAGRKILLQNGDQQQLVQVHAQTQNALTISPVTQDFAKIKTQVYLLFEAQPSQTDIAVPEDSTQYRIFYDE